MTNAGRGCGLRVLVVDLGREPMDLPCLHRRPAGTSLCIVHISLCTMHIRRRERCATLTDPRIAALEVELSLLARHHLHSSQHSPERLLDRSGYHLLSRLELGPLNLKQLAEAFRLDPSTV